MVDLADSTSRAEKLSFGRLIRSYPFLAGAILVGTVALSLQVAELPVLTTWLLVGFALVMAGRAAIDMVRRIRRGSFGVDALALMAIGAALAVGEQWAAYVIVLMLTTGEALEDYAGNRARRDLSVLLDRAPRTARVLDAGDAVRTVPVDDVSPGDRLLVGPNEVVPVDGTLLEEWASFDESSLTGESMPVEHRLGELILSGSVNGSTAARVRAARRAADSQYQQIVRLVETASRNRPPLVRLADRYALPFTAFALSLALMAWWLSGEAVRFAEVLVVATPCPLLVAAPVAFIAGTSRSARDGAIVKSGGAFEMLTRARSFVFDKTGTLTHGRPSLVEIQITGDIPAETLLALAAAAEQSSPHVLARATVAAAAARGLRVTAAEHAEEAAANGVAADVGGQRILVGKRTFIAESTDMPVESAALAAGQMGVYVAVGGEPAGVLIFRDETRAAAGALLAQLSRAGVRRLLMVTGDDEPTARHVANEVGITEVHARCLPGRKVEIVEGLRDRPVVMVGDGVNDAPVLSAAEVGIAMGAGGATAASESADVVLLYDDIAGVATVFHAARRTVRVALESIWIGIGLSSMLMVVAAFGFLPALTGALLQEAIDVISILWALRALTASNGSRGTKDPRSTAARAESGRAAPSASTEEA